MDSTLQLLNNIMFIKKEECIDDFSLDNSCLKEEIASICDEEAENDIEARAFLEEKPFSFGLVNSGDPQHLFQDEVRSLIDVSQIKEERKKAKSKKKIEFSQKTLETIPKSGRINRDNIFKNKNYFCRFCQKPVIGRKMFKKHFKVHYSQTQNEYLCLICNCTFHTVSHVNRHIMETHFPQNIEDEKLFVCNFCEKRFHGKRDLERHMFQHTGEGGVMCGECGRSFAQKCHLTSHIFTVHGCPDTKEKMKNDDSLFICNDCNYSSREKSSLREHIKRHIGYKEFKCSECNYTCTSGGDLQKHRTIHSENRPFVCNRCRKTFKRRSHLLIHFNAKYGCAGMNKFTSPFKSNA